MADGRYRIFEAQLPLVGGLGGHNLLVVVDPDGRVIGELDGLATGADGKVKPIGYLPSDRLKIYPYPGANYYRPDLTKAELASGDRTTIMNLWSAARAAGERINALDLQYPFLGMGQNSNSVASTLIAAMGLAEPAMPDSAPIVPGARSILLDPRAIRDIQRQFNIGAPQPQDTPDAASQSDGPDQSSPLDTARWPFGPVGAPSGRRGAPQVGNSRSAVTPVQTSPARPVPGAQGPTSTGGRPAPVLPPARPGLRPPSGPVPAPGPVPPPLRYAPEEQDFGSSSVPPSLRSGVFGGLGAADEQIAGEPVAPMLPGFGVPGASAPGAVGSGEGSHIGDGNGIGDWRSKPAPTPPSNTAPAQIRRLTSPLEALLAPDRGSAPDAWAPSSVPRPATPPAQDAPGGLLGMLAAAFGDVPSNPFRSEPEADPGILRQLVGRWVQ
jgi:hypothetical protein